jgi:glycerol-3-phosphate O-acyltransferase/dihydroxyacetone phosphate acyltransferase
VIYPLFKPIVQVALRWYYRRITTTGLERVPRDGPVFLAVNHPNALIDALVVGACLPRQVGFTAKATIFANPLVARFLTSAGVVPLRRAADEVKAGSEAANDPSRNAASFDAVAQALARGAAIVVFPEGKSHDDPTLAPLRTGLARMALHATQQFGVRSIRIVPIGLLFERKERPRSRVLVQVGEPIDVDALIAANVQVSTFTDIVSERLRAVTLNFDSAEDAERLQTVGATLAALLEPAPALADDATPLGTTLAVVRRLDRAHTALRDQRDAALDARATAFEQRVRAFRAQLDTHRLDVHDIAISARTTTGFRFAIRELLLAAVMAPVGLWGRLTHFVPIQLARALALRNVTSRDEPAMNTLVAGLVLVLGAYAVQSAMVWSFAGPWWALAFLLTLVPSASSDLRYGDRMRRARARMRAYFTFRRDPDLQRALLAEADALRREAGDLERAVLG